MVFVKDILSLPSLSGSRIVAGEKDLERVIKSANVMEVPDIGQWAQEGDFLITTGLPIRNLPEVQSRLASDLYRIGVAALAFKPKRFVDEIPREILAGANECGLPVILLPESAIFSHIVYEVVRRVVAESLIMAPYPWDPRTRFMEDWLDRNILSEEDVAGQLRRLGYTATRPYFVLAIDHDTRMGNDPEILRWQSAICPHFPCRPIEGNLFVVMSDDPAHLPPSLSTMHLFPRYGLSNPHRRWTEAKTAVAEARTTLQIARCTGQTGLLQYSDLGLDLLLLSISKENEARNFLDALLKPLLDYDVKTHGELIHTLETYLNNNQNTKRTAVLLHAHYNTVTYRIQKIESLTNRSLNDSQTALQLAIALKLRPYLQH
ncbi:MAG: PucR family transcriptional regulator [Bacilli bacterium]